MMNERSLEQSHQNCLRNKGHQIESQLLKPTILFIPETMGTSLLIPAISRLFLAFFSSESPQITPF